MEKLTELQVRVLDALRSGEYKQGKGQLRTGHEYCCLGVMCDVYDPEGWLSDSCHRLGSGSPEYDSGDDGDTFLGQELAGLLGLNATAQQDLTIQNDDYLLALWQIADLLERLWRFGDNML